MPYPFAHPAAVLPLARPMGRFAAPSALVIGSIVPDLWYFVPFVDRDASHGMAGLFWFCLPLGVAAYVLFHRVFKQPLIALLSSRLAGFTPPGLPPATWTAVAVSIFVGAATHVVWDELTHWADYSGGHNVPQHVSTALGSAILMAWLWRKLRNAPAVAIPGAISPAKRACTIGILAAVTAICAASPMLSGSPSGARDVEALRQMLRISGSAAILGLSLALFVYCAIWQLGKKR